MHVPGSERTLYGPQLPPGDLPDLPLGRLYENGSFQYFLQVRECRKTNRAKIRVKKWIDMPEAEKYDAYISRWHYFLKELSRIVREDTEGILSRNLSMYVLKEFYLTPYDRNGDFYARSRNGSGRRRQSLDQPFIISSEMKYNE